MSFKLTKLILLSGNQSVVMSQRATTTDPFLRVSGDTFFPRDVADVEMLHHFVNKGLNMIFPGDK